MYKIAPIIKKLNEVVQPGTLKTFSTKNGISYSSLSKFHESMNHLSPELLASVTTTSDSAWFLTSLADKLGINLDDIKADDIAFPIPYRYARGISRLAALDQVEFVKRWKENGISLTEKFIDQFIGLAVSDGFELAYKLMIEDSPGRSLEVSLSVFTHALAHGSLSSAAFVPYGYTKAEVEKALDRLVVARLLSHSHRGNVYEVTEKAKNIYANIWKNLPDRALATLLSTQFSVIGLLGVNTDKARMKSILKAIRGQLDYYENALDNPLQFDKLVAQ